MRPSSATPSKPPAVRNRRRRSYAAASSVSRQGPRSGGCWKRSPKNVRRGRSRRRRRRLSTPDATRARFAATADRIAALQERRADELAARVREFVPVSGDERALDAGTVRTLHHVPRPELVVAELARVTRPDGLILVVDQIAPTDPLAALELNRFERARDPSHTRALADVDLRHLFEANGLVLRKALFEREPRELEPYLDLAGCEGEAREQARTLAPHDYTADVAWYLLRRP